MGWFEGSGNNNLDRILLKYSCLTSSERGWSKSGPGGKNLLNFQSSWIMMKPVPLHPSRLPDSDGIFTFSNGVRMEEISRSVHQAKHAKILDADCTCPYSQYGDMAGLYHPYDDVSGGWHGTLSLVDGWRISGWHVSLVVNSVRTRGPIPWRHVSLIDWLFGIYKNVLRPVGFDPRTSPLCKDFITLR